MCRDRGDFILRPEEDMVDSDTSSIGTFAIPESFTKIRKKFPESWIWQSITMSNETG